MPIGFKNGTDGSFTTAINAMQSASKSHHFLGVNENGMASIVNTTGNPDGHIVLRGGSKGPNIESHHVQRISSVLKQKNVNLNYFAIAFLATVLEQFSVLGIDNFIVPISSALCFNFLITN